MRITEMDVIPVAHREPPLRNSWGAHSELAARTIVRLTTSDGLQGIAETYGDDDVIDALERARSLVEGRNPYNLRPLELRLQDPMAYGAIDTAVLDLLGQTTGQPVAELLGGRVRDEVEFSGYLFYKYQDSEPDTAAITPEEVMTPEAMVAEAKAFVEAHGFQVLKLKGGVLPPDEEFETLELLTAEFPDAPLRIDPNGTWSVETTIDIAHQLREAGLNIEFLEDPVPTMNAHRRLKQYVDYPIATNMFVTDVEEIAPAVELGAVDVILSDHHYWGGLTGNMRLDTIANALDLGVGMHSNSHLGISMAAMTHVAAAMPTLRYACDTHYPWMADDVIANPIQFQDGHVSVPEAPGLGVELDEAELSRLHELYTTEETLAYSSVESMAAEYADAMAEVGREDWLPNKPRW